MYILIFFINLVLFIYCYNLCYKSNFFDKEYYIKLKIVVIEKRGKYCIVEVDIIL